MLPHKLTKSMTKLNSKLHKIKNLTPILSNGIITSFCYFSIVEKYNRDSNGRLILLRVFNFIQKGTHESKKIY